jgi:RNA polymerase sigma factor (sigma-70 family)
VTGEPSLQSLLASTRETLLRWVRREGEDLARRESPEDLVQGIHVKALEVADRFEYRGEKEFLGWLFAVASQHLARRRAYWSAWKRDSDAIRRLSTLASKPARRVRGGSPATSAPGPSTVASGKEEIELAMKAIALLLPKDRDIVQWITEGLSIRDTADRLGISYDAAERARLRAVERLRKAFEIARTRRSLPRKAGPR